MHRKVSTLNLNPVSYTTIYILTNCAWYNSVDETNRVCFFINSPSFQRSLNEPLKLPARFSYFDV